MQFHDSLHIVLTCSFVLLLAYLLSILFSYLASSVIHGSSSKATTRRPSTRRPSTIERQISNSEDMQEKAVMDRLQEEDEEDEDAGFADADQTPAQAARYELADSIFDSKRMSEEHRGRDDYSRQAYDGIAEEDNYMQGSDELKRVGRPHENEEGIMSNGEHDVADVKGSFDEDEEYKESENGSKWDRRKEDQFNIEKEISHTSSNREYSGSGSGSSSKLSDAQGSSSLQQRLPPTWSDLERMVNLNSMKRDSYTSTELPLVE